MSQPHIFTPQDALLIVDVQRDFCPSGLLPIPKGDNIIPVLNKWIEAAEQGGATIAYSRDWHPADHCSFAPNGGQWPVHCVAGTAGAEFHEALRISPEAILLSKGVAQDMDQYSALNGTPLANTLQGKGITSVWVGGLALDVCVKATALDAVSAGFTTNLIPDGSLPVTAQGGQEAVAEMRRNGVRIL